MAVPAVAIERPSGLLLDLEVLESLPCGCVVAAYSVPRLDVAVVSLEAKGPYCLLPNHRIGALLHLGALPDGEAQDEADPVSLRP